MAMAASLLSGPFLAPVTGSDYLTSAAAHQGQVATGVLLGFIAAFAAPGIAIVPASAHSVLTVDLVDRPGHPTRAALERVLEFLQQRLQPEQGGPTSG